MVRKVRIKFIMMSTLAMTFFMILLIASINIINYRETNQDLNAVFEKMISVSEKRPISENAKHFEEKYKKKQRWYSTKRLFNGRFYSLIIPQVSVERISISDTEFAQDEVDELAKLILDAYESKKQLEDYKYQVDEYTDKMVIHILDCTNEMESIRYLFWSSFQIGLGALLIIFVFIYVMSGKVVAPLQESVDKQKQFITNASHELKTPVAVIGTNMEVLQMDVGDDNEWIKSTQRQVKKLRKLIQNLLSLAKLEEAKRKAEKDVFSFSGVVLDFVEIYKSVAETENKKIINKIEEGILLCAEEESIRDMIESLVENAVKYALVDSTITVSLIKEGKKIIFCTENEWIHDVNSNELAKVFDRFYRGDKSRRHDDKIDGYGLGLAIAKAAAEKNEGEIYVNETKEGKLRFKVIF